MNKPMFEKVYVAAPTFHLFKTYCRRHEISPYGAVHVTSIRQLRGLQGITLYCVNGFMSSDLIKKALMGWFLSYPDNNKIKHVDM